VDVSLFDFELPEDLIALRPAAPRDSARLLVVHSDGRLEHRHVRDLPEYLHKGDRIAFNDTKVIPARLHGRRLPRVGGIGSGPKIEILLHRRLAPDRFSAFARPARKLSPGDQLQLGTSLEAGIAARGEAGEVEVAFALAGAALDAAIAREGQTPLPPYIAGRRKPDARDLADYQTMFATHEGSVAAPTAGLHFTPRLIAALDRAGVARAAITLHVGAGTFLPVTAQDTGGHRMHGELVTIDAAAASLLSRRPASRLLAAGTTVLRALESAADANGQVRPFAGETDIFITPGYRFRTADMLLTNFHLPRSTLFMLVAAFSGLDTMKRAYAEAIAKGYRFYSYGDACLLFRAISGP